MIVKEKKEKKQDIKDLKRCKVAPVSLVDPVDLCLSILKGKEKLKNFFHSL